MTASKLVIKALKLPTSGAPISKDVHCAMCGTFIPTGDPAVSFKPQETFNDGRNLASDEPSHICPACASLWQKPIMMGLQKVVITEDAVYPLGKLENRAWFFITPPKPPFVAVFSDAKLQHLIWRTPITRNSNLIYIRVGDSFTGIRLPLLHKAFEAWKKIRELDPRDNKPASEPVQDGAKASKSKKIKAKLYQPKPADPFIALDLELTHPSHGRLRDDYTKVALEKGLQDEVRTINQLTPLEAWAMIPLIYREPVKPDPINSDILKKLKSNSDE